MLGTLLALSVLVQGQVPAGEIKIDPMERVFVAGRPVMREKSPGHYVGSRVGLYAMVAFAKGIDPRYVKGVGPLTAAAQYMVTIEPRDGKIETARKLLEQALKNQLHLEIKKSTETREYALLSKIGPLDPEMIAPTKPGSKREGFYGFDKFEATGSSLTTLADCLADRRFKDDIAHLREKAVNATGLTGDYDVHLKFPKDKPAELDKVLAQTGLKIELKTKRVDIFMVSEQKPAV